VSAVWALVRNELRLYRHDRRAVIVGVLVPILISAFFGYIFGGARQSDSGRVAVAVVNEDPAPLAAAIVAALKTDTALEVALVDRSEAERLVRRGKVHVAVVIPANLSAQATRALFTARDRPSVEFLIDASERMSGQVVQGLFAEHAMQEISKDAFSGAHSTAVLQQAIAAFESRGASSETEREDLHLLLEAIDRLNRHETASSDPDNLGLSRGLAMPYEVATLAVGDPARADYNSYAHSFAGMSVQFILFGGIDAGVLLLLLRERGIWQRLRSAPLSRSQLLLARVIATSLISLFQFAVIFTVAILVFRVRIGGSVPGFLAVLREAGVVESERRGTNLYYSLKMKCVAGFLSCVEVFTLDRLKEQSSLLGPEGARPEGARDEG